LEELGLRAVGCVWSDYVGGAEGEVVVVVVVVVEEGFKV